MVIVSSWALRCLYRHFNALLHLRHAHRMDQQALLAVPPHNIFITGLSLHWTRHLMGVKICIECIFSCTYYKFSSNLEVIIALHEHSYIKSALNYSKTMFKQWLMFSIITIYEFHKACCALWPIYVNYCRSISLQPAVDKASSWRCVVRNSEILFLEISYRIIVSIDFWYFFQCVHIRYLFYSIDNPFCLNILCSWVTRVQISRF